MTLILLAVLGWCAVSVVAAAVMSAVFVGARNGEARNVPAWRRQPTVVPDFLPAPRRAPADAPVAV